MGRSCRHGASTEFLPPPACLPLAGVLVLDRAAAEAAHDRILTRHRVPAPVSADLLREDAENDAQDETAAVETPARNVT